LTHSEDQQTTNGAHDQSIPDAERYSRQILFSGVGREGQQKLSQSRIAIIGCGATGSALATLLGRAGVGFLRLIDRDYVEPSNLQRQTLYDERDAAEALPKAVAARNKLLAANSGVVIEAHVDDLTPSNAEELLGGVDLILDGTDNFETRYLINDYAVKNARPWIYTAAVGSYGVTMNVLPGETACLCCIFPDPPQGVVETCDVAGILGPAVNLAASLAAMEALKFLTGQRELMRRTLISFDAWRNDRAEIRAERPRARCRCCQQQEFPHLAGEARPHISMCGRNSVQIHEKSRPIDFAEMELRLTPHGAVKWNEYALRFWRGDLTMTLFADGRAIIQGTTDVGVARSMYARFVGS